MIRNPSGKFVPATLVKLWAEANGVTKTPGTRAARKAERRRDAYFKMCLDEVVCLLDAKSMGKRDGIVNLVGRAAMTASAHRMFWIDDGFVISDR